MDTPVLYFLCVSVLPTAGRKEKQGVGGDLQMQIYLNVLVSLLGNEITVFLNQVS